jgi:MoaA/NifB/PqqE/SkfB family radical SAM enzyme
VPCDTAGERNALLDMRSPNRNLAAVVLCYDQAASFTPVLRSGTVFGNMDRVTSKNIVRLLKAHHPFVVKNVRQHIRNWYTIKVKRSNIVPPYSAVLYVSHHCNLACTYCTQKTPDVVSEELSTEQTIELMRIIRKETDYLLLTGGEPLLRPDIVELARAARRDLKFHSVMVITNGTHLREREEILDYLTSLVVSLDALTVNSAVPRSKPYVVEKVIDNLLYCRSKGKPSKSSITISTVIMEENLDEVEKVLEFCVENGFVFSGQTALNNRLPNRNLLESERYRALVEKIIDYRKRGLPINGTPKLLRTMLEFKPFNCYPTMFPRVYPNGDVFYPCEPLKTIGGNLFQERSFKKIFERGRRLYGDIPFCQGVCYLFGNVMTHFYVEEFWSFAGDSVRY